MSHGNGLTIWSRQKNDWRYTLGGVAREQAGRRPAIVMQDDIYAGSLPTTIVIPLSSSLAALRFPGTASIKAPESSGLRTDSVALVFQIRAIDRSRVKGTLGSVSEHELIEIQTEVAKLLSV